MRLGRGFSIVELLITMTIGLTLIAGLLQLFVAILKTNRDIISRTEFIQDPLLILTLIRRDIKRIGLGNASTSPPSFSVSQANEESPNSCMLISYDKNYDGTISDSEWFGYRLSHGKLQTRRGAISCTDSGWSSLTDPSVLQVEQLRFETFAALNSSNTLLVSVELGIHSNALLGMRVHKQQIIEVANAAVK